MFDKVQFSRRRFLGTTALAIVAAQFNGIGSAKARSEPSKFDGATAWINSKPLSSTVCTAKSFWLISGLIPVSTGGVRFLMSARGQRNIWITGWS